MSKVTHYIIPIDKIPHDPSSDYRIIDLKDAIGVDIKTTTLYKKDRGRGTMLGWFNRKHKKINQ